MNESFNRADQPAAQVPRPHHRPTVPDEVLSYALQALREPTQPLVRAAAVIQQNALLNTLFLRYANAAEHGFRETVTSTDRGVALLGAKRLAAFLRALQARTRATGSPDLRRAV